MRPKFIRQGGSILRVVILTMPQCPPSHHDDKWLPQPGEFEILLERETGEPWAAPKAALKGSLDQRLKEMVRRLVVERTGLALDVTEDEYRPGKDPSVGIFDCVGNPTRFGSPSDLWAVALLTRDSGA